MASMIKSSRPFPELERNIFNCERQGEEHHQVTGIGGSTLGRVCECNNQLLPRCIEEDCGQLYAKTLKSSNKCWDGTVFCNKKYTVMGNDLQMMIPDRLLVILRSCEVKGRNGEAESTRDILKHEIRQLHTKS